MTRLMIVAGGVFLLVGNIFSQVLVINELMARNSITVSDQNGEYDDWIELYNNSEFEIPLEGYFLSDNEDTPCKWAFPDTVIQANGFLVLWADNETDQIGLHTGFRLSGSGETLSLTAPDSTTVDRVEFPQQYTDISWGRFPDGTGEFRNMPPTFNQQNRGDDPGEYDPSEAVFNDGSVHKFDLRFYTENWQDSLKYYFEILDEEYFPARLIYNDSLTFDSIGVRYKGNSSYMLSSGTIKKPYKFRFDKYIDDQEFFGLTRLNFSNCVNDPSFMREKIAYEIARRYMPAPRTGYADIYIEGGLVGFYVMVEQVDQHFLDRYFEDTQGCLFKAGNNGANLVYTGENLADYQSDYELKSDQDEENWVKLIDMINKLNDTPGAEFVVTMQDHLNLDNCIRHLAFNMVLSHFDSYTGSGRNYYLYHDDENGQFNILPWDLNETFGVYTNSWNVINQDMVYTSNMVQRPLIRRIMEDDSLLNVYKTYIYDMISGPASSDSVEVSIANVKQIIESYVIADENKLYSYRNFLDNLERDVRLNYGKTVPGLTSFSRARNVNLVFQLNAEWVYPGDTDNNGIVDEYDILPIGIFLHMSGSQRNMRTFDWEAHQVPTWDVLEATYADANGDGKVDEADAIGIGYNWGYIHTATTNSYEIDIADSDFLEPYEESFHYLYNVLPVKGESGNRIKDLLEELYGFREVGPEAYDLGQNYPNPFNSMSMISFTLPEDQHVTLRVYNSAGRVVLSPIEADFYRSGSYSLSLNASDLASGYYLYRIESGSWSKTRSMIIVK